MYFNTFVHLFIFLKCDLTTWSHHPQHLCMKKHLNQYGAVLFIISQRKQKSFQKRDNVCTMSSHEWCIRWNNDRGFGSQLRCFNTRLNFWLSSNTTLTISSSSAKGHFSMVSVGGTCELLLMISSADRAWTHCGGAS